MHVKVKILIVGIVLIILSLVVLIVSLYIPNAFIHSDYKFLYVTGEDIRGEQYTVVDGKVTKNDYSQPANGTVYNDAKLFVYDTANNSASEISYSEAALLTILPSIESPDGFSFTEGEYAVNAYPFEIESKEDLSVVYLQRGNLSLKLNLIYSDNAIYNNFRLLGWIEN